MVRLPDIAVPQYRHCVVLVSLGEPSTGAAKSLTGGAVSSAGIVCVVVLVSVDIFSVGATGGMLGAVLVGSSTGVDIAAFAAFVINAFKLNPLLCANSRICSRSPFFRRKFTVS